MRLGNFFIVLILGLSLASCGNYVEEINIDENGSGNYKIYTDIIPSTVQMAVEMTMMFAAMDTTHTYDKDSIKAAMVEKVWEDFPDEIDSVIDFSSEIPDSLANYGNNKKYIEAMTTFMKGGRNAGYVNMGIEYTYSSLEDLQGFMDFFESIQSAQSSKNQGTPLDDLSKTTTDVAYRYSSNTFSRKVTYINPQTDVTDQEEFEKLFGKGKYVTVVNTKRKIKKVKGEHLKEQSDYKAVFEYDFLPALSGALNTDFEIIFE